jgi:hydrogenase maturation protein HypF
MSTRKRYLIKAYGIVQGIGFRPFVSRTAARFHIVGDVCNKGSYVEIHAEGEAEMLENFRKSLKDDAPDRSEIIRIEVKDEVPAGDTEFKIIASTHEDGDIFVSPDIAICPKCARELFDPGNRRYLHPFINCTDCGPRLTILDSMPYDRVRTSMGEFPMCGECSYEYTHPSTRRFHAQPVCCNDCGPRVYIPGRPETGEAAILYTRQIIRRGGIAAIKGIGGFHLCCDATNEDAVSRLRQLKHRPQKPFAVMMRDMDTVRRECEVEEGEEDILTGPKKPILLLKKKTGGRLCPSVAPGNPTAGVMLPYAPVQLLLFTYPGDGEMTDCFVMTSGNPSGAPICRDDSEALQYLSPMIDVILSHDRKIRLRADDSVTDFIGGKPYMIRRSRGYAPIPAFISGAKDGSALAVGGELKNTFCLTKGGLAYLSPYIGDLADLRSVRALEEAVERMETLLEIRPGVVACDMHPRYNSVDFARRTGLPLLYVQHHYAHVLSCMAENDFHDDVIGISFDGTGYGTDGTIWGGEFLRASPEGFERLGSLAPFRQAGGDASSREGWRIAVSLLYDAFGNKADTENAVRALSICDEENLKMQFMMLDRRINTVTSTSAGRLFDAVSAILGIRLRSTFEGEASMALQFAADPEAPRLSDTEFGQGENGAFTLSPLEMIRRLVHGREEKLPAGLLAGGFHTELACMIRDGAVRAREQTGITTAALSGGVFQNSLLVEKCVSLLSAAGFTVLTHSLVPPNDGGIALGQAYAAMFQSPGGVPAAGTEYTCPIL